MSSQVFSGRDFGVEHKLSEPIGVPCSEERHRVCRAALCRTNTRSACSHVCMLALTAVLCLCSVALCFKDSVICAEVRRWPKQWPFWNNTETLLGKA